MNSIKFLFLSIIYSVFIFINGCNNEDKNSIKVAVSANTQFAMKEIVKEYKNINSDKIDLIIGSSGKLTAQIEQGAPYNIFLSADEKYPDRLYRGKITVGEPKIYAKGKLVLISSTKIDSTVLLNLDDNSISKIAIPNSSTAPYGAAAEAALKKLDIYESIKNKLIFGESVSQVNQYIFGKAVDLGFTAMSVIYNQEIMNDFYWIEIPNELYPKINQAAVMLKNDDKNNESVKNFYDYLFSDEVKTILQKYGYQVN